MAALDCIQTMMSTIAIRADETRRELRQMEEQYGPDDPAVQQMRAVALQWIAELREEHRLAGIAAEPKTA